MLDFKKLNIKWTPYIPHEPTPKQLAFLMLRQREALFGGAAGGGKAGVLVTSCNAAKMGYDPLDHSSMEDFRMAHGHKVLTPFGFKLLDDIAVGDAIINPDGTTSSVILVHPDQERVCYELEFLDGAKVIVAEDHLWAVKISGNRTRRKVGDPYELPVDCSQEQSFNTELCRRYKTVTTLQFKELFERAQDDQEKGRRPRWPLIPLMEPANFQQSCGRAKMMPPYSLGVWLGDGSCLEATPSWFKPDEFIAKEVRREYREYGMTDEISDRAREGSHGFIGGQTMDCLRSLKLSGCRAWEKFVPTAYKNGPVETRRAVLQGLLDTDGHVDSRGHSSFCSTSERLVDDVQYLARSLGYMATKTAKDEPVYTYNGEKKIGRPAWVVYLTGRDRNGLFRLPRKKGKTTELNNEGGRRLVSIRRLPKKLDTRCITVAHPNGLYITNDFIVTHNSDALLMSALQWVDVPGYNALVFRKTLTDLKQPGALLQRAHEWLDGTNAKYVPSEHKFIFPTFDDEGNPAPPATLNFGYIGDAQQFLRYQGIEIQGVFWDEVTQHDESHYRYLFSRLRKLACHIHKTDSKGRPNYVPECSICRRQAFLPLICRSATNPGGPGAAWVKRRFRIEPHISNKEAARTGEKQRFIGKHSKRPFIPSFAKDNPFLNLEAYGHMLDELDPITREQLAEGRWDVTADSQFKRHWARYYSVRGEYIILGEEGRGQPYHRDTLKIFAVVDPATTTKHGPGDTNTWMKQPSFTVISIFGLTDDYNLIWLDMIRFRRQAPEVIKALLRVNKIWRPQYFVMESNGVGNAIVQQATREGLTVKPLFQRRDKLDNAAEAMIRMERGLIWFPENASWLQVVEDEVFYWTGDPRTTDDIVDTMSNAARDVTWEDAQVWKRGIDNDGEVSYTDLPDTVPYMGGGPVLDPAYFATY